MVSSTVGSFMFGSFRLFAAEESGHLEKLESLYSD